MPNRTPAVRRIPGFDYSQDGVYFVTIVTHQRDLLFGDILAGEMHLNEIGAIVEEEWRRTAVIRPGVELDEFVVMPNHVHGILLIGTSIERTDESVPR
jgi:REP element-mobilizing transposase RayT